MKHELRIMDIEAAKEFFKPTGKKILAFFIIFISASIIFRTGDALPLKYSEPGKTKIQSLYNYGHPYKYYLRDRIYLTTQGSTTVLSQKDLVNKGGLVLDLIFWYLIVSFVFDINLLRRLYKAWKEKVPEITKALIAAYASSLIFLGLVGISGGLIVNWLFDIFPYLSYVFLLFSLIFLISFFIGYKFTANTKKAFLTSIVATFLSYISFIVYLLLTFRLH